ncbi:MAG: hypothetical protein ABIP48_12485 [Planctomycetota bacterium]
MRLRLIYRNRGEVCHGLNVHRRRTEGLRLLAPLPHVRYDRHLFPRQDQNSLLAHDRRAFGRLETANEADPLPWPPDFIPRDPDAVRIPEFRLAVMRGELLAGEDIFPIGLHFLRASALLVVGVDDQRALDLGGLLVKTIRPEERQAAAEAPGLAIGMLGHRVGPNGHHLGRRLWLVFAARNPRHRLLPIQLRATDCRPEEGQ